MCYSQMVASTGNTIAFMSCPLARITMIFFVNFYAGRKIEALRRIENRNILNIMFLIFQQNGFEAAGRNENEAGGESVNAQNI